MTLFIQRGYANVLKLNPEKTVQVEVNSVEEVCAHIRQELTSFSISTTVNAVIDHVCTEVRFFKRACRFRGHDYILFYLNGYID